MRQRSLGHINRRNLLQHGIAAGLLVNSTGAGRNTTSGADAGAPHLPARAKQVIVLYMSGGYSHVDSFDPKPRLLRDHGTSLGMEQETAGSGQP